MFTGIIECTGMVTALKKEKSNLHISIRPSFLRELRVDQSIAHNGICLTVFKKSKTDYTVTAIKETLSKTNLGFIKVGDEINLERCMMADGRFDGHIVQGHVDCTAKVTSIKEENGSWVYKFKIPGVRFENLIVEKGSICVNGVSLTVVDISPPSGELEGVFFSVAIIPYTYHHTNFHAFRVGDFVNIEFDVLGKYVANMLKPKS